MKWNKNNEAMLEFNFAYRLKERKITFLLQQKINFEEPIKINNYRSLKGIRPDIVILKNKRLIAIVEIKKLNKCLDNIKDTRQYLAYSKLDVPIFYINSYDNFDITIENIEKLLKY